MLTFRIFYRQFGSGRKLEVAEVEADSRQTAIGQVTETNPLAEIVGGFFIEKEIKRRN